MRENNQIFALDIGTRSIVGIILEKAEQAFVVKKSGHERTQTKGNARRSNSRCYGCCPYNW